MLAGHLPYWIKERVNTHPDELLRARLQYVADANKSLAEQDLVCLADGLEGRSTNPVSLLVSFSFVLLSLLLLHKILLSTGFPNSISGLFLFYFQLDSLQHPCADLGLEMPSMLRYEYHPEKEVSSSILKQNKHINLMTIAIHRFDFIYSFDFFCNSLTDKHANIEKKKIEIFTKLLIIFTLNDFVQINCLN